MLTSHTKVEQLHNIQRLYQHVEEHFIVEEAEMDKQHSHGSQEHKMMLAKLTEMNRKVNEEIWNQDDAQDFLVKWGNHIIDSDMSFHTSMKQQTKPHRIEQSVRVKNL